MSVVTDMPAAERRKAIARVARPWTADPSSGRAAERRKGSNPGDCPFRHSVALDVKPRFQDLATLAIRPLPLFALYIPIGQRPDDDIAFSYSAVGARTATTASSGVPTALASLRAAPAIQNGAPGANRCTGLVALYRAWRHDHSNSC